MYPLLKPALRHGWRDRETVQFGVAPAHAMVLGPVDAATGDFLELLDGTRSLPLLREEARRLGLPEGAADALVDRLVTAGLLDDPAGGGEPAAAVRGSRGWDRVRPDVAALSLVHPAPGAGIRAMGVRRETWVRVRGAGRVGAAVAAVLSASGVGRVEVTDGGCVEPADVAPAGLAPDQIGERREAAAGRLVRRASPWGRTRRVTDGDRAGPALVVLAPRDGLAAYAPDPAEAAPLLAAGVPHLYTGVVEGTGVVGPLVLPGVTPCAGCLAAHRADREPYWGRLLAQWRSGRRRGPAACDTALATMVTGLTAAHALIFLDGRLPASAGARLEPALPALTCTPLHIEAHPECPCGAAGSSKEGYPSAPEASHVTMAG